MVNINSKKDILMVCGLNSLGNIPTTTYLQKYADDLNLPYESEVVDGANFILKAMDEDDINGGLHHTHEWLNSYEVGHSYLNGDPKFPFTVCDNYIPEKVEVQIFDKFKSLPYTGKLWLCEKTGGINTNPKKDPFSIIDYSYKKTKEMLIEGVASDEALKRIVAIIHINTDHILRNTLNRQIINKSVSFEIRPNKLVWFKDQRTLDFFGKDDFYNIEGYYKSKGIDKIFHIKNDGSPGFYDSPELVMNDLFLE